ncbi:hypothetical protein D9M71_676840 [compost metagenome]
MAQWQKVVICRPGRPKPSISPGEESSQTTISPSSPVFWSMYQISSASWVGSASGLPPGKFSASRYWARVSRTVSWNFSRSSNARHSAVIRPLTLPADNVGRVAEPLLSAPIPSICTGQAAYSLPCQKIDLAGS